MLWIFSKLNFASHLFLLAIVLYIVHVLGLWEGLDLQVIVGKFLLNI